MASIRRRASRTIVAAIAVIQLLEVQGWGLPSWIEIGAGEAALRRLLDEVSPIRLIVPDHTFDGDLDTWLAAVRFDVPDSRLPALPKIGGKHVSLSNFSCADIHIGITEGDSPRRRKEGGLISGLDIFGGLTVELQRVRLRCSAYINYGEKAEDAKDWADVVVTTDASMTLKVSLSSSDTHGPKIPDKLTFDTCWVQPNFHIEVPDGSKETKMLEMIPFVNSIIAGKLNDAVAGQICNKLIPQTSEKIAPILERLHSMALAHLLRVSPIEQPAWQGPLVSWDEVPLVRWIERFQEILPNSKGVLRRMLNRVFPSKKACLVQDSAAFYSANPRVCFKNEELCLLGDHSKCLVSHDFPGFPHMDVTSFNVTFENPRTTILEGNGSLLHSRFNDSSVRVSVAVNTSFLGSTGELKDVWGLNSFDVVFEEVDIGATAIAALDQATFLGIPSVDYLQPQCLQPAFRQTAVSDISVQFRFSKPTLTFSQDRRYVTPLMVEFSKLIQHVLDDLWRYERALAPVLRGVLFNRSASFVDDFVTGLASKTCPKPKGQESWDGDPPLINPPVGAIFNWIAVGVCGCVVVLVIIQEIRERRKNSLEEDASSDDDVHSSTRCPYYPDALCMSECVPWSAAVGVPVAIIAGCLFLAGSNYLYFAESLVNLELGSAHTVIFEIMPYSIFYSVRGLREFAHMPLLSDVLFVFSGLLPYGKLMTMFAMWMLPTRVLSRKWRGHIFTFVDQIGKFSLVDIFVIQFINGALFADIVLPFEHDGGLIPVAAVRTKLRLGFFAFVLATIGSLVLGHVCLYYHQQDPMVKKDHADEEALRARRRTSSSCAVSVSTEFWKDIAMDRPQSGALVRAAPALRDVDKAITGRDRFWIGPALVFLVVLVINSYIMKSFTVELSAAGQVLTHQSYSLVSFAMAMPSFSLDVSFKDKFGTAFSMFTFILFALVMNIVHDVIILVIWYVKIKPQWWAVLNTATHTLAAWSALDVCIISMVLTLVEMGTSDFVHLNDWQRKIASKVLGQPVTDARGVHLKVTLDYGTFFICLSVMLHTLFGRLIRGMVEAAAVSHESDDNGRELVVETSRCEENSDRELFLTDKVAMVPLVSRSVSASTTSGQKETLLPSNMVAMGPQVSRSVSASTASGQKEALLQSNMVTAPRSYIPVQSGSYGNAPALVPLRMTTAPGNSPLYRPSPPPYVSLTTVSSSRVQ